MKVRYVTHTIPAKTLSDEIAHVTHLLNHNGYATKNMDFTDLIARRLSDDFAEMLVKRGVRIKNHSWELKYDKSLRIKVFIPYEEDLELVADIFQ